MDIKDILSPSEKEIPRSTPSAPQSPAQSPFKYIQRTQSGPALFGSFKQGHGASPLSQLTSSQHKMPMHIMSPAHQAAPSPLISPVPNSSSSPHIHRTTSTQSMDTLADLASMQTHQPMKSAAPLMRGSISYDGHASPSFSPAIAASLTSNPRASIDINMMDGPKQITRTDFSRSSLSTENQHRLSQLAEYLLSTPSAYEAHVEMINILHEGLINHIYPSSDPRSRRDPRSYDLLQDLRHARDQMEKLFAVGEDLWSDWIQDESLLAQTAEERIAVVEKCRKSVEEEVSSIKLWSAYGEWVHHCYSWSQNEGSNGSQPDEERLIGQELFTRQLVMDTWQEALEQSRQNIAHSQVIWKKFLEIRLPDIGTKLSSDRMPVELAYFQDRLKTPHLQWDETFQLFSSFVSANLESDYEEIMIDTTRSAARTRELVAARDSLEAVLDQAQTTNDRDAEYTAFQQYIQWERIPAKKKKTNAVMIDALYRRAELRFPSDTSLWEEHITFLVQQSISEALPLLERATKHCPWSGNLWSHYLLCSERLNQTFQETEEIKHKATSTGLLEAAGIEDVISVHAAWCSYLRRRSTRPDGNEEDIDVAEMGIRSSIETLSSLGVKLGLGEAPGSSFRLRRVYITFLTDSERWDNARHEFDTSISEYGKSYEFWIQFYQWEMMRWRKFASARRSSREEGVAAMEPPDLATAVLEKAINHPSVDYPEPLWQAFLVHCEDLGDAEELQQALFRVRKLEQALAAKRQLAEQAAEASAPSELRAATPEITQLSSKRKRDEKDDTEQDAKKIRGEDVAQVSVEEEKVQSDIVKRDREHATILVGNLPEDITDTRIRQYFSTCGTLRSLKVLREDGVSAVVEFEDDDAAKYALSRDGQEFAGAILSVTLDTGSTLYVTNYAPSADEHYIRELIGKYGDIISVRFPSLKGNKNRRFCYVQLKTPQQALQATELDGGEIDGLPLVCKISNPAARTQRANKAEHNNGFTIFVGQLDFKTTEKEISEVFTSYGETELLSVPQDQAKKGRNKGIAFVTYTSAEAAKSALEMDQQQVRGRKIVVRPYDDRRRGSAARQTISPSRNGQSASPAPSKTLVRDDLLQRQIFLTDIPDTVNESRLRSVGEKFGKILRVVLKTNHQGAILEYATIAEAGEAALGLDQHEIDPGRQMRVVTEQEMKGMGPEQKSEGFGGTSSKTVPPKAAPIGAMPPVRRPGQGGKRGGNLGQRSAALFREQAKEVDTATNGESKRSNDDFRKMMNKG